MTGNLGGAGLTSGRRGSQREEHHGPAFLALFCVFAREQICHAWVENPPYTSLRSAFISGNEVISDKWEVRSQSLAGLRLSAFIRGSLSPWPPCLGGEDSFGVFRYSRQGKRLGGGKYPRLC